MGAHGPAVRPKPKLLLSPENRSLATQTFDFREPAWDEGLIGARMSVGLCETWKWPRPCSNRAQQDRLKL